MVASSFRSKAKFCFVDVAERVAADGGSSTNGDAPRSALSPDWAGRCDRSDL